MAGLTRYAAHRIIPRCANDRSVNVESTLGPTHRSHEGLPLSTCCRRRELRSQSVRSAAEALDVARLRASKFAQRIRHDDTQTRPRTVRGTHAGRARRNRRGRTAQLHDGRVRDHYATAIRRWIGAWAEVYPAVRIKTAVSACPQVRKCAPDPFLTPSAAPVRSNHDCIWQRAVPHSLWRVTGRTCMRRLPPAKSLSMAARVSSR